MTQDDYDRVVAEKKDVETRNDNLRIIVISLVIAVSLAITAAFYYKNSNSVNDYAVTQFDSSTKYVSAKYDEIFLDSNITVTPDDVTPIATNKFVVKQAEINDLGNEPIPVQE